MKKITKKDNSKTHFVYTNYESDHKENYTYFIGEEVSSFDKNNYELQYITIPAQKYIVVSDIGKIPDICINTWQKIWNMSEKQLGGKRSYKSDFELYQKVDGAVRIEIYIGIRYNQFLM